MRVLRRRVWVEERKGFLEEIGEGGSTVIRGLDWGLFVDVSCGLGLDFVSLFGT